MTRPLPLTIAKSVLSIRGSFHDRDVRISSPNGVQHGPKQV